MDYEPTFLIGSFKLQENEPDFSPPGSLPLLDRDTYEGRCVMTATASTQLDVNLRTFLKKATLYDCRDRAAVSEKGYLDRLIAWYQMKHNLVPPVKEAEKVPWAKQQKPFVDDLGDLLPVSDLQAWYADKPVAGAKNTVGNSWNAAQQAQDPLYSAVRALSRLGGKTVLSQALGGFNAALTTRKQTLQIPIENPMEEGQLQPFRKLTADVKAAVGPDHPMAPLSDKVFNPIRSGTLASMCCA